MSLEERVESLEKDIEALKNSTTFFHPFSFFIVFI